MILQIELYKAIKEIKNHDFDSATKSIHKAMIVDDSSPEVHNLLGIIAEYNGDLFLARKHFRAAYALDPTFASAMNNLERLNKFYFKSNLKNIDYGENYCKNI